MVMMGLLIRNGIVRYPFDTMVGNVLLAFFTRWNVFAVTFAVDNFWHVPPSVDLDFEVMRRLLWRSPGNDLHRLACSQHPVHARSADPDSLLSSTHPQSMKFRTIEQFSEDERDLFFDNARPVILDTDFVPIGTRSFDMNPDLGKSARFLASVERIVDSLFNRRQESFSRIIEAKQVPVLGEKFADGYVALFCRHRLGRDGAALRLFTCFFDVRHICVFFHFAGLYFGTPRAPQRTRANTEDEPAVFNSPQALSLGQTPLVPGRNHAFWSC